MSQFDDTNVGSVWKKRENAHQNAPDYKIDLDIEGILWEVAAWKRKPTANQSGPIFKLKLTNKTKEQQTGSAMAKNALSNDGV